MRRKKKRWEPPELEKYIPATEDTMVGEPVEPEDPFKEFRWKSPVEMNLHKYATGSMLDEAEFQELFAEWVPIASSLFIRGNVGVELSDSYFPLRSKMAIDCGAEKMYFICENADRAKVMEGSLLGDPDYARRIIVVSGGYAPRLTLPCKGGKADFLIHKKPQDPVVGGHFVHDAIVQFVKQECIKNVLLL
jgi:hypothetical protein